MTVVSWGPQKRVLLGCPGADFEISFFGYKKLEMDFIGARGPDPLQACFADPLTKENFDFVPPLVFHPFQNLPGMTEKPRSIQKSVRPNCGPLQLNN